MFCVKKYKATFPVKKVKEEKFNSDFTGVLKFYW